MENQNNLHTTNGTKNFRKRVMVIAGIRRN